MLLWELSFNRVPYKGLNHNQVIDHVMNGKRETLAFNECPRDIANGFTEIITLAWQHDPRKRPTNPRVSSILESLYRSYESNSNEETNYEPVSNPSANNTTTNTINVDDSDDDVSEYDNYNVLNILPLSDGIEYHNSKAKKSKSDQDYKICWECFKSHENLGNKMAKYWMGLYLREGFYVEKDQIKAKKLFKDAADSGITEAQLEYAFAYNLNDPNLPFDKKETWKYLNKAAKNNNPTALYHLGNAYYSGNRKMEISQDKEKGIRYLKLSALLNNHKAIKTLETYGINL
jgi:hypothetical protein